MADAQGSPAPVTRAVLARLVACAALAVAAAAVARWGLERAGLSHGAADLTAALLAVALVIGSVELLVLRRLRLLNAALRPVAGGDLFPPLPRSKADELGQLTDSIQSMLTTLRSNYEDLRKHDELRRTLVANVSHELRTPLTSMQGYLETTKLAGPTSPDWQKNLDVCLRETRKLAALVKDLFELSKLDTRHLEFHFEEVSLVEIADQVGLAFEQRMADKSITFSATFPDDPLDVWGDGNRLGQVIQNLLANAVHFTPEGGRITLACERRGNQAVLTVSDTGIGIAAKDQPHIFESFFHLEKSRSRNLGGTGLGLAICKAIVEAHKGRISVSSLPGEGSTFVVELAIKTDSSS
jgi:signal transduction histidine kinase